MAAVNFFKILGPVLERNIAYLASTEGVKVSDIHARICAEAERNKSEWYSGQVPNLNYQNADCRLAYLYIVAAANAATFRHVITNDTDLLEYITHLIFNRRAIRICALGAGPGTELLGLAKLLDEARPRVGHAVSVDFQLLDKVQEWTNTWYGLRDEVLPLKLTDGVPRRFADGHRHCARLRS